MERNDYAGLFQSQLVWLFRRTSASKRRASYFLRDRIKWSRTVTVCTIGCAYTNDSDNDNDNDEGQRSGMLRWLEDAEATRSRPQVTAVPKHTKPLALVYPIRYAQVCQCPICNPCSREISVATAERSISGLLKNFRSRRFPIRFNAVLPPIICVLRLDNGYRISPSRLADP
ncbi:hypothetical protein BJ170DRAFT_206825 [Xylariales sp. AK1849]|nr:hypothetical protein BJ170DRAFT_206825 [Xylariales sp. AK1849]